MTETAIPGFLAPVREIVRCFHDKDPDLKGSSRNAFRPQFLDKGRKVYGRESSLLIDGIGEPNLSMLYEWR